MAINDKQAASLDRIASEVKGSVLTYDTAHVPAAGRPLKVGISVGNGPILQVLIGRSGGMIVFNERGTGYRDSKCIEKLNEWLR